jgi:pyruvate dehydrogenase E2 component (dihydrolipoamide acetyltransferase)
MAGAGGSNKRGDVVAGNETQKGAIEVEIFDEGLVSEIVAPVGTKVPVGGLLARIGELAGQPQEQAPTPVPPTGKTVELRYPQRRRHSHGGTHRGK